MISCFTLGGAEMLNAKTAHTRAVYKAEQKKKAAEGRWREDGADIRKCEKLVREASDAGEFNVRLHLSSLGHIPLTRAWLQEFGFMVYIDNNELVITWD